MRSAASRARRFAPLEEQFFDRLVIGDGCWTLLGEPDSMGYMRIGHRHALMGHRVSYEIFCGPIPDGFDVDHLCRTPACCHPEHLEAVTHRENVLRGTSPLAEQARQTHCTRGHPLSGDNLYLYHNPRGNTRRVCRQCTRDRYQEWKRAAV